MIKRTLLLMRTTIALIRLRNCAVWSGPSLSADRIIGYCRSYWGLEKALVRLCGRHSWTFVAGHMWYGVFSRVVTHTNTIIQIKPWLSFAVRNPTFVHAQWKDPKLVYAPGDIVLSCSPAQHKDPCKCVSQLVTLTGKSRCADCIWPLLSRLTFVAFFPKPSLMLR